MSRTASIDALRESKALLFLCKRLMIAVPINNKDPMIGMIFILGFRIDL